MAGEQPFTNLQQQIADTTQQIAQAQARRDASLDVSERARLNAQIASLEQTLQALQTALNNSQ